jgi:hypothetical protein
MSIVTEWVRRCTRCLTVDERAAWGDPPPPMPLVVPSVWMARLHRRAARLATPLGPRRPDAVPLGWKEKDPRRLSAPGVFPKPCDGRRALRQGIQHTS